MGCHRGDSIGLLIKHGSSSSPCGSWRSTFRISQDAMRNRYCSRCFMPSRKTGSPLPLLGVTAIPSSAPCRSELAVPMALGKTSSVTAPPCFNPIKGFLLTASSAPWGGSSVGSTFLACTIARFLSKTQHHQPMESRVSTQPMLSNLQLRSAYPTLSLEPLRQDHTSWSIGRGPCSPRRGKTTPTRAAPRFHT